MVADTKTEARSEVNYLLDHYIMILRAERGLAYNTFEGYRRDLRKFKQYCTKQNIQDPKALNTQTIQDFLEFLRQQALSPTSTARCMAAIRGFFRFLNTEKGLPDVLVQMPRSPKQGLSFPKRYRRRKSRICLN